MPLPLNRQQHGKSYILTLTVSSFFPYLHIQSVSFSFFSPPVHPVRSQLCVPVLRWSSKRCPQSICPAGDHHGGSTKAEPRPHPRSPPNTCFPSARPALPTGLPAGTRHLHPGCNPSCIHKGVDGQTPG